MGELPGGGEEGERLVSYACRGSVIQRSALVEADKKGEEEQR